MSTLLEIPEAHTMAEESTKDIGTITGPFVGEASWLQSRRAQAWDKFVSLPMPGRTDEAWRFASLKRLDFSSWHAAEALSDAMQAEVLARSEIKSEFSGRMIFGNDRLLSREVHHSALRQSGVLFMPLEQAAAEHGELLSRFFMKEETILGGQKASALHASQVRSGLFLYVPRGVEINVPIEICHWLHGKNAAVFPHTLIVAEDHAKVTVVEHYRSTAEERGLACGVLDLWVGRGAHVTHVGIQDWSTEALSFQSNATVIGRDATARMLALHAGSNYARTESVSHLREEGGRAEMLSASVPSGTREVDQRTLQIHEKPHTWSDLLYKNALDHKARTVFSGLIRVATGAHFTDAYQKVRNLLLTDEAEANSMPGLEIEADNVRCTHGATSGQISPEELFYLLSRGITKNQAQRLIAHGFIQEVFDRLGDPVLAERLGEIAAMRMAR